LTDASEADDKFSPGSSSDGLAGAGSARADGDPNMKLDLPLDWILVFATLAPLPLTGLAHAQSVATPAPEVVVEDGPRYVWTGVRIGDDGARVEASPSQGESAATNGEPRAQRTNPRATAEAHLKELAAIQLSIEIDRKLDEASTRLDELWVRAASRTAYVARFDVLQSIALARSALEERRGRKDAALAAVEHLLPGEAIRAALGERYELEPAPDELATEARGFLAAPPFEAVRSRLRSRPQAPQQGGRNAETSIEANVRAWLSANEVKPIREIGTRAVPALEKIVLENLDGFAMEAGTDPLTLLFELDEARGARLALEQFDKGGFFWRKRILRSMERANVLTDPGTWSMASEQHVPPILVDFGWLRVLELLLQSEDVRAEALRALRPLAVMDELTPTMQAELTKALTGDQTELTQAALTAIAECIQRSTVVPLLEAALAAKDVAVRRFAAQLLQNQPESKALLARATDPDGDVRRVVAKSLRGRQIPRLAFIPNVTVWSPGSTLVEPALGEEGRQAVRALAKDEDPYVRLEIATMLQDFEPPLETELYVALAADESANVRERIAGLESATHPALPAVLERLAGDATPNVSIAFEKRMQVMPTQRIAELLPALVRRLQRPEAPSIQQGGGRNSLANAIEAALLLPEGMTRLLAVVDAQTSLWLVEQLMASFPWPRKEGMPEVAALRAVDPKHLATLVRVYMQYCPAMGRFWEGAMRAAEGGLVHRQAWLEVLSDTSLPRAGRAQAAAVLAHAPDPEVERAIVELLKDPSWATQSVDVERDALSSMGRLLAGDHHVPFLLALVRDPEVQSAPLAWLIGNDPNKQPLAMAILDRWLEDPDVRYTLLTEAIEALPASDDPRTVEVLRRCLRDPRLDSSAASVLGRIKRPFSLELLSEALRADWISDGDARADLQRAAAEAMAGFLTEDAAQRLIAGVPHVDDPKTREGALAALEQIRKFLDEKKRWDLRDTDLEKRAQAVHELYHLLSDPDAATRAQAAKSMATMNAVEHLPKLIGMLKDKSPEVRAAAQQAIDQLNAKSK
jgi:HEAT repeat protein